MKITLNFENDLFVKYVKNLKLILKLFSYTLLDSKSETFKDIKNSENVIYFAWTILGGIQILNKMTWLWISVFLNVTIRFYMAFRDLLDFGKIVFIEKLQIECTAKWNSFTVCKEGRNYWSWILISWKFISLCRWIRYLFNWQPPHAIWRSLLIYLKAATSSVKHPLLYFTMFLSINLYNLMSCEA